MPELGNQARKPDWARHKRETLVGAGGALEVGKRELFRDITVKAT